MLIKSMIINKLIILTNLIVTETELKWDFDR